MYAFKMDSYLVDAIRDAESSLLTGIGSVNNRSDFDYGIASYIFSVHLIMYVNIKSLT